ncbi:serine/threonine phosphatase [Spirulina subsalsa FACHB-351]|uniref:Serine/threonine phosphatase n=1 Tax=Spirulina subsalsa FACHB-351 TaxID=234711 RepID=A0ABT3L4T6_9CYAN|nr:serine/threonine phosphatase [Spirulina subsalsa]MCW6036514.1 serine/threonine phosphatase [Spirulina subsalsa FACHB-351]
MLVCPECQSKNPTQNKYCQKCGTSLTVRDCEECGGPVGWEEQICPHCGASMVKPLLALIIPKTPAVESENVELAQGEETEIPEVAALDPNQRYHIYSDSALSPSPHYGEGYSVQVWDSQPLAESYLSSQLSATATLDPNAVLTDSSESQEEGLQQAGVPAMAIPYQLLKDRFCPIIPRLYDAWETPEKTVVLLEDRQNYAGLTQCWEDPDIPLLQVLSWLDELAQLWQNLASLGYCQSLLEASNLRVDEDRVLCLQQLYPDDPEHQPELSALGQLWQRFFSQTGRTLYGPLADLLGGLMEGKITVVDDVRSRLREFARQQEAPDEEENNPEPDPSDEVEEQEMSAGAHEEKMNYPMEGEDVPTIVLPMQLLSLTASGLTHVGGRDHNEDTFGIETLIHSTENPLGKTLQAKGIYIVCDGMGGHAAGEVASAMAVESLQYYFREHWTDPTVLPDEETIRQAILTANEKIYTVNLENSRSGSGRMGTTLVMVLVQDRNVAIAHVGDSRVYQITRKQGIEQLTRDHEVGQREILRGVDPEDAYARPDAFQLTQALGPRENDFVKPDVLFLEVHEDTVFLLCSDGVSDGDLLEKHYEDYLTPLISSRANLEEGLYDLVRFANIENGHDNITGVVVRVKLRPNLDGTPIM